MFFQAIIIIIFFKIWLFSPLPKSFSLLYTPTKKKVHLSTFNQGYEDAISSLYDTALHLQDATMVWHTLNTLLPSRNCPRALHSSKADEVGVAHTQAFCLHTKPSFYRY